MYQFKTQIKPALMQRIRELGWDTPSIIQQEMIPYIFDQKDIFAIAPTGSGKTAAFLIPLLNTLEPNYEKKHSTKILILSPTRELSRQIAENARDLLSNQEGIRTAILTGGMPMNQQIRSFKNGADIVVGTPNRIKDHIRRKTLKVNDIAHVVIDEFDEMMTMGFLQDIKAINDQLETHQTILTSATCNKEIEDIALSFLIEPHRIEIASDPILKRNIDLHVFKVTEKTKLDLLFDLLKKQQNDHILIFTNTKKTSDFIAKTLCSKNYSAVSLHSDMDPKTRIQTLNAFKNQEVQILCATDVAARGLDIDTITSVILYDYPDRSEFLTHRIGRTGRANKKGAAYIFLNENEDKVQEIIQLTDIKPKITLYKCNLHHKKDSNIKRRKPKNRSNKKSTQSSKRKRSR